MKLRSQILAALVFAFGWLSVASAQPPFTPPVPVHTPAVKDRACVADCRQDARVCSQAAKQVSRMCAEQCAAEAEAAAQVCADDPSSVACRTARAEARACLAPCAQDFAAASRACQTDSRGCVAQCPNVEPPPDPGSRDAICVAGCASDLRVCLGAARERRGCLTDDCADLIGDAREACTQDETSEECRLARTAALDCLRACRDDLRHVTQTCVGTSQSCIRSCPADGDEPPTP